MPVFRLLVRSLQRIRQTPAASSLSRWQLSNTETTVNRVTKHSISNVWWLPIFVGVKQGFLRWIHMFRQWVTHLILPAFCASLTPCRRNHRLHKYYMSCGFQIRLRFTPKPILYPFRPDPGWNKLSVPYDSAIPETSICRDSIPVLFPGRHSPISSGWSDSRSVP